MGKAIGIDLGTTNSAVAVVRETGHPEILRNQEGDAVTPSVVLFQDFGSGDEPLVGSLAKRQAAAYPDDIVQHVKRFIGDPYWIFDSASGQQYSATEISAVILKRLKQDAELALGEDVTDAVITVPAYFDDARRTATKQAGAIAGLNVLRVINEPTAAALAYGVATGASGTVVVYDLGGGTFDVTALRIDGNEFDVLATDGDRNLGGFDFDNALMNVVARALADQGAGNVLEDLAAVADLREKAEFAKKALSNLPQTNVQMSIGGRPYRVTVTRAEFEDETRPLLNRTEELIEDVMAEANLTWGDVDRVLLVGGATRMPAVRELVTRLSGRSPELDVNPDEVVALGAALRASLDEAPVISAAPQAQPVIISDVASQALGVITVTGEEQRYVNTVVIPRNAKIPSSHQVTVFTTVDRQEQVRIQVTQGDDPDPEFATVVGSTHIQLPRGLAKESPLDVVYHYDMDQTIFVEVMDGVTGGQLGTFEIDRLANLTPEQVASSVTKISAMVVS